MAHGTQWGNAKMDLKKKKKAENKAFLDALQKLLKEPHFSNHTSKLVHVYTLRLWKKMDSV